MRPPEAKNVTSSTRRCRRQMNSEVLMVTCVLSLQAARLTLTIYLWGSWVGIRGYFSNHEV